MKRFLNRCGLNSMMRPVILLCGVMLSVQVQAKPPHHPRYLRTDNEVLTIRGKLEVERVETVQGRYEYKLSLDGKVVGAEAGYGLIAIAASYPEQGPARLVLLELDSGGSGCPAHYKVLEVKDDGSTTRSKEFGNCSPMARPSFTNGVLRVDIPKIGGAIAESWRYQDGKLLKIKPTSSK